MCMLSIYYLPATAFEWKNWIFNLGDANEVVGKMGQDVRIHTLPNLCDYRTQE